MELSTRELFSQLHDKLIIKLEPNEILCPECKGLRFILVQTETQGYVESCRRCYTGKLSVCKHCDNANKSECMCYKAQNERSTNFQLEQSKKEHEKYLKATKINFKDYDGKFLLDGEEYVKDKEGIEEWIYEKLQEGEDILPDYLWTTTSKPVFSIDLTEIISEKCEDGYDEMYSRLDTDSPLLTQAQSLISQWEKEQGEALYVYENDDTRAVILTDIINEISDEIRDRKYERGEL